MSRAGCPASQRRQMKRYPALTIPAKNIFFILCLVVFLIKQAQAQATTFMVTTPAGDASAGSLGAALTAAALNPNVSDIISFSALFNTPQTITLTMPLPAIVENVGVSLTIAAPASSPVVVNGAGLSALNVSGGGTLNLS